MLPGTGSAGCAGMGRADVTALVSGRAPIIIASHGFGAKYRRYIGGQSWCEYRPAFKLSCHTSASWLVGAILDAIQPVK